MTGVNTTLTIPLVVSSISPLQSGTGGGVLMSIEGKGLSQDTQVYIDGRLCPLVIGSSNYSLLKCLTPTNVNEILKYITLGMSICLCLLKK